MMDFDLKEVFAILDENGEGQIQLRRFVDVANNYYSDAEQLARITKALDPTSTGLINFEQFCEGIAQISSLQGVSLKDVASDLSRRSRENSLAEDSDQRSLNQDGSTTTFNEYDVESDETSHSHNNSKTQAAITTRRADEPERPSVHSSSPIFDTSVFGDEEEFSGVAETDSIHLPSASSQRLGQPLRRASYIPPVNLSDDNEQFLHETVEELQKTVDVLTEQKVNTTDRLAKIQSENSDLKSRLLALEDRFHDLEGQQARSTASDQKKYTDYITQKDRSFLQEKEVLQSRINAIEAELKHTHTSNGQMKKDVKELQKKLDNVDVQLHESQVQCNELADDNEKLLEQLRLQREELEAEKLMSAQLADQLTFDSSRKMFGQTLSRTETMIKSSEIRIQDLDAQVRALKQENDLLKRENEKMKEDAVISGIKEGRGILSDHSSLRWDEELELLSKDELLSINQRLREYIDSLLLQILVNNPTILEKR